MDLVVPVGAKEGQHDEGDHLALDQHPSWIAQCAELECEADPILWPASSIDMDQVVIGQHVMPQRRYLVGREVEQQRPLPRAQNMAFRHAAVCLLNRSLFWTTLTPRKLRVFEV